MPEQRATLNGEVAAPPTGPRGALLALDLLEQGHSVRVRVGGDSMLPGIAAGEQVLLAPVSAEQILRRGDIVYVRRADGDAILHRIARVFADGRIQTRGDNHWRLDDAVPRNSVIGVLQAPPPSRFTASLLAPWPAGWRAALVDWRHWPRMAHSWWGYQRERHFRAPRTVNDSGHRN